MSSTPRNLLIAASAVAALGAGAAPAIAADANPNPTPLQAYIAKQPLQVEIPGVGTRAQNERGIRALTADARSELKAIHVVEGLPTETVQQTGKRTWLEGQRYAIRGDDQTIAGLRLVLSGDRAKGAAEVNRQWRKDGNFYFSDKYGARGLEELHVQVQH